jgi:hypothetical protein
MLKQQLAITGAPGSRSKAAGVGREVAPCCWMPTLVNYENATGANSQITSKFCIKVENL